MELKWPNKAVRCLEPYQHRAVRYALNALNAINFKVVSGLFYSWDMSSLTHDPSSTRQPTSSAGHSRSSANENKQWKRERRRRRRKSRNPFKTFVQAWEDAVNRKEKRKQQTAGPKSWIERKVSQNLGMHVLYADCRQFMVGVVLLLFGWSSYTFLGDILNKSLTNHDKALVPLAPGGASISYLASPLILMSYYPVVLTVFYWVLWIMFAWTYVKLVFTPPGFARDHIPPTDPPLPSDPPPESLPNNPYINPLSSIYSTSHPNPNPRIYPPSVGAPTSAHRPSIDAATHRSVSLNEHGEFDEEENIRGVPYVAMPSGIEGSGSNVAIPPTPRAAEPPTPNLPTSPTSLPSAIAPKKPRPGLLRNSANPPVPTVESAFKPSSPTTDASLKLHQSKRPSTSSRPPSSPPTSPAIAAFSNTRPSESSIEPQPRATSGFQFHSTSYITRPPQSYHSTSQRKPSTQPLARTRSYSQPSAHSRTHSNSFTRPNAVHTRTQSESRIPNIPTAMPTPSLSAPQTPTYTSAGTRPTWSFAGRTEALEDDIAVSRDGHEGPRHPYLDDLPPVQAKWQRRPSDYPALDPYYRYCSREGIIKPMRAHHCRICDAVNRSLSICIILTHCIQCILGYDHHCPWVGGCVGARNRKVRI